MVDGRSEIMLTFAGLLLIATLVSADTFNFDECGKTKRCVGIDGCKTVDKKCVAASYRIVDDTHIEWELSGPVEDEAGSFIALGVSDDDSMGDDFVVECSKLVGEDSFSVKLSYNDKVGPKNVRILGETADRPSRVKASVVNKINSNVYCKATVLADGSGGDKYYKLKRGAIEHILLVAGITDANGLKTHFEHPTGVTGPVTMENVSLPSTTMPSSTTAKIVVSSTAKATVAIPSTTKEPVVVPTTAQAPVQPGSFNFDDCGKTKKCVGIDGCKTTDKTCVAASYRIVDDTHIEWELSGPVENDAGSFIALGVSDTNKMGEDFVVECSKLVGEKDFSVKLSYNSKEGPKNVRIADETNVRPTRIKTTSLSISNGVVYCKATVLADGTGGDKYYKLKKGETKYILLAAGTTTADGLKTHYGFLKGVTGPVTMENIVPAQPDSFNFGDCDKTKKCVGIDGCKTTNKTCVAASFRIVDDTHIEWELSGPVENDAGSFIALGVSDTVKMGDDYVVECSKLVGEKDFSVKLSYNSKEGPKNVRIPDETNVRPNHVSTTSLSSTNGNVYCKATVLADGTGGDKYYKLKKGESKYILLAAGLTTADGLKTHYGFLKGVSGPVEMGNSSRSLLAALPLLFIAFFRFL